MPELQSSRLAQTAAPPRCSVSRSSRCTGEGPNSSGYRGKSDRAIGGLLQLGQQRRPDLGGGGDGGVGVAIRTGGDQAVVQADGPRPVCRRETPRSEEHTSELQSRQYLVCRLLLEKKKKL